MTAPTNGSGGEFVREERYIVIKRKKLTRNQEEALRSHLRVWNIGTVECVVAESDWPEYETVWRMIEARCSSTPPAQVGAATDSGEGDDEALLADANAWCSGPQIEEIARRVEAQPIAWLYEHPSGNGRNMDYLSFWRRVDDQRTETPLYSLASPTKPVADSGEAEPALWQRRYQYVLAGDPPGKQYQWENCSKREATNLFYREAGYEYRPLYASMPSTDQEGLVGALAKELIGALEELREHLGDDMIDSRAKRIEELEALLTRARQMGSEGA